MYIIYLLDRRRSGQKKPPKPPVQVDDSDIKGMYLFIQFFFFCCFNSGLNIFSLVKPWLHLLFFASLHYFQIFQLQPSSGSSLCVWSRSPSISTWCLGRTRRRGCSASVMLRPSQPCGENTEIDPAWPMIKLPGLCVIITRETFWTKLEDASPIALARDWASCTQTNKLSMTLIIHFNFIFSVYCILICMLMSSFVSPAHIFRITQLFCE